MNISRTENIDRPIGSRNCGWQYNSQPELQEVLSDVNLWIVLKMAQVGSYDQFL